MNAAGVIALASVHGVRLSSNGVCVVAMPSSKLTDELRRAIRANKTELLRTVEPSAPCPNCGTSQWWRLPNEPWHCRQCAPFSGGISRRAATLTLPCHTHTTRPVRALAQLDAVLATACEGLAISPDRLRQELEDDLDDIGELNAHGLTAVAEILSRKY